MSTESSAVSQGTCVAVIADLEKLEIVLSVPETYYGIIEKNRESVKARITRSGEDSVAEATVSTISPYIDPQSRSFSLTLKINDGDLLLRPGMFVTAELVYNTMENVLLLPQKATCTDGTVYMYDSETEKAVYLGNIAVAEGSEYIVIPESYSNTAFITEGQNSVLEGERVRVI